MKELNIIEAIKMPVGTEFTIKPSIVSCSCPNVFINGDKGEKVLVLKNKELVPTAESILSAKFIPIQKPVSFMEAVESGKKVKVDYSDIDTDDNHTFSCEDYRNLASLIFDIVNKNGSRAFKEIILNGKWYIED